MTVIYVVKKGRKKQKFQKPKLYKSIRKAGAAPSTAKKVTNYVTKRVKNNMRTSKIRAMTYRRLRKYSKSAAKTYKAYRKKGRKKTKRTKRKK